jgi:hypothetical protein
VARASAALFPSWPIAGEHWLKSSWLERFPLVLIARPSAPEVRLCRPSRQPLVGTPTTCHHAAGDERELHCSGVPPLQCRVIRLISRKSEQSTKARHYDVPRLHREALVRYILETDVRLSISRRRRWQEMKEETEANRLSVSHGPCNHSVM